MDIISLMHANYTKPQDCASITGWEIPWEFPRNYTKSHTQEASISYFSKCITLVAETIRERRSARVREMSQRVIQIMVAFNIFLAVCCVLFFVQIWQLKEQLDQQCNEQKQFQVVISGELQAINKKVQGHYDILYETVQKNREDAKQDARDTLSLFTDLLNHVAAVEHKYESDRARLDEKVDSNDKKVTEKIGENQQKVNNSMRGFAELFVNEMTTIENRVAKFENETHEKIKQLEAMAREPIMIENKVHIDTEYHHHHHQVVEFREPQLSLGERIGKFIGGVMQNGATSLLHKAMEIIGI